MALKKLITAEDHKKMSKDIQAHYVEKDDGFILDLEGEEDTGALKRAKDREVEARKAATAELKAVKEKLAEIESADSIKELAEAKARLAELTQTNTKTKKDLELIEKSWESKVNAQRAEHEAKLAEANGYIKLNLVDNAALQLAQKISTAPGLILPHIKSRLLADMADGKFQTRILDAQGQPSAMSLDDLGKEFVANKEFSAIMIASKASGGAGLNKVPTGSAPKAPSIDVDLSILKPDALVAQIKAARGE
jgi:hypothetical protein